MRLDFLPPLLRGVGTTIILIATLISSRRRINRLSNYGKSGNKKPHPFRRRHRACPSWPDCQKRLEELRLEAEEDTIVEKVFENRWFEWVGFVGTAIIAGSFYLESFLKRAKRKIGGVAEADSVFEEVVK